MNQEAGDGQHDEQPKVPVRESIVECQLRDQRARGGCNALKLGAKDYRRLNVKEAQGILAQGRISAQSVAGDSHRLVMPRSRQARLADFGRRPRRRAQSWLVSESMAKTRGAKARLRTKAIANRRSAGSRAAFPFST